MSLSALVEQQVLARPGAVAVACPHGSGPRTALTYSELGHAADRLAAHLVARGVGPGDRVVTCLRAGPDLVTALLAIVRTGAAYVPLDPDHPVLRRRLIARDCAARAVVTTAEHLADFDGPGPVSVALDADAAEIAGGTDAPPRAVPGPEDAAYVCYTSGTTGTPKGVVVPHRAVLDLVGSNDFLRLEPSDVVAQTANPAFDAFTFEIWATLAAGARLVILDRDTVVEPQALERALGTHHVTVMFLTTALLHRVADERPAALGGLRAVLFGGEMCDPRRVREIVEGEPPQRLLHMYGPTEATTFATWYEVPRIPGDEPVPIGRPVGATRVVVVDPAGTPVGPGGTGELLLGGPGLATGYLGLSRLTEERFVEDRYTRDGGRLYRTGDRVRVREDGDLEFAGRLDDQVKLRGFRIELGEVEAVLRRHPAVSAAVASVQETADGDRRLVAHVVPSTPTARPPHPGTQVAEWREIYDTLYADGTDHSLGHNFAGWYSSYDTRPIPPEHIRESRAATVERVRELGRRRILEIGAGAGLLLAELAADEECEEYWATDLSQAAVTALGAQVLADARLREKVRLSCRAAHCTDGLPTGHFDTIVVDSVVQCFPGLGHLRAVVERLLPLLAPGGALFLGDLRNLELSRSFQTGVELADGGTGRDLDAVRRGITRRVELETELLLAPPLFAALAREYPAVRAVDVRIKRGTHCDELTRYRYEAVLHTAEPVADLADVPRVQWGVEVRDCATLRTYLRTKRPDMLRVAGVPNARVHGEWAALRELADPDGSVAAAVARLTQACPAPGPEELCRAAEGLGFRALPTWSPDAPEAFDLVLLAPDAVAPGPLTSVYDAPARAAERCAGTPNAFERTVGFEAALRTHLRERLPDHMVPAALVVVDELPLTPGGKVDRRALPACPFTPGRSGTAPGTPVQEILRDLFAEVLEVPRRAVHADSDFFRLGGHSLSVARLLKRIRQVFGAAPRTGALYEASTPALLAELIGDPAAVQTGPVGSATDSAVLPLRLRGALDLPALEAALIDLGRRHEALRNSRLGAAGTRLRTLSPDDHVLELAVPADAVDQWSQAPLAADLAWAYEARATGDTPRWASPAHGEAPRAKWGQTAPTALPGAPGGPADGTVGSLRGEIDAALHERLTRFAAEQGATLSMVVHTALAALLTRIGAGSRTTVALAVPARGSEALRRSVGPYGRVLALTVDGTGDPAFTELLRRTRAAHLAAYRDGAAPLAEPGGVSLTVLQEVTDVYPAAGLSVRPEAAQLSCPCSDLGFTLTERQDASGGPAGISVTAVFRSEGVGEAVAAALTGQLLAVLEAALDEPLCPVGRLGAERAATGGGDDGWTGRALRLPRATVAGLFAERVGRGPHRPALAGADRAELDSRSDLLAHVLLEHRAGAGATVATAIASPTAFAVAALAVAKAGAVCLPLDPTRGVPDGARPVVLLLDETADRVLPAVPGAVRLVRDPAADALAAGGRWPVRDSDRTRPLTHGDPLVLAPSGDGIVVVGAEAVVAESATTPSDRPRRAAWLVRGYPDADATLGLLGALVSGAHVVVPPAALYDDGAGAVLCWLREREAHTVLGGGNDRALVALARREGWTLTKSGGSAAARLVVEHGPGTRTRPAPGHRVYILDEAMRPVAPGATGALYIAGVGVAQGYAGRPAATGERFVPDPFGGASGTARMWRTGRSGRPSADGSLQLLDEPWDRDPYDDVHATFVVVRDALGRSALWPAAAAVPDGWRQTHAEDLYQMCVDHLDTGPEGS